MVDQSGFTECLHDSTAERVLHADSVAATQLGVRGTPTVLINNLEFLGMPDDTLINRIIRDMSGRRATP